MEASSSGVQILQIYDWLGFLIILFGILFSIFYGVGAVWIFQRSTDKPFEDKHSYNSFWWIHQIWINFLGSAVGWLFLFLLYGELRGGFRVNNVTWQLFITFAFSLIGMMGALPLLVWSTVSAIKGVIDKLFKN